MRVCECCGSEIKDSIELPEPYVYYAFVSGIWQKTNKYAYENLTDTKRVKIDAEYSEEAREIIKYELYDNHEAVIEILGDEL